MVFVGQVLGGGVAPGDGRHKVQVVQSFVERVVVEEPKFARIYLCATFAWLSQ